MLVCIDKVTCVRMYDLIEKALATSASKRWRRHWRRPATSRSMSIASGRSTGCARPAWRSWSARNRAKSRSSASGSWTSSPHRKLIKEGFELPDGRRIDLDEAFKKDDHPFRIAIVCAMWLTGFDVPSLSTLYLDKPLKAHTLMQAIARANRVNEGKNNGLIVDYCGILKNLRKALATFAGAKPLAPAPAGRNRTRPGPKRNCWLTWRRPSPLCVAFLAERSASLDDIIEKTGFERNAAILAAKEAANENDETRKRFEVMCREVFKKFKACINIKGVNAHRREYDAINIVYKSLQKDRDKADISDIIRKLHEVIEPAIEVRPDTARDPQNLSTSARSTSSGCVRNSSAARPSGPRCRI